MTNIITENNETNSGSWITWDTNDFGNIATRYVRVYAHTSSQYLNMSEFRVTKLGEGLVVGKIGKAINFDGADDYINCGSATSLDDIVVKTIEVLLNFDTYGESESGRIIQKANINADGWQFLIQGGVGKNRLYFGQDWNNGTFAHWWTDADTLTTGTWYDAVVVYDKGATVNDPLMYIDGVLKNVTENAAPTGICDSDAANDLWIGARRNSGSDKEYDGIIEEVRISNTARSAAWLKATYYSNWDELITFGSEQGMPTHYYYGYITENEVPVSRIVRLYYRDTGDLVGDTVSNADTGYYYLTTTISGEHFIVTIDDNIGKDYNALILDRLLPRGIE